MNSPFRKLKRLPLLNGKRTSASEKSIVEQGEYHSARLGKIYIAAGNASWVQDDLMREVRLAHGAPRRAALDRLDALNRSYDLPADTSAEGSRYRRGLRSIGRTLANGTVAGVVMFGLAVAMPTSALVAAPTPPETSTVQNPDPEQAKQQLAQLAAVIRAWLSEIDALARPIAPAGCPAP